MQANYSSMYGGGGGEEVPQGGGQDGDGGGQEHGGAQGTPSAADAQAQQAAVAYQQAAYNSMYGAYPAYYQQQSNAASSMAGYGDAATDAGYGAYAGSYPGAYGAAATGGVFDAQDYNTMLLARLQAQQQQGMPGASWMSAYGAAAGMMPPEAYGAAATDAISAGMMGAWSNTSAALMGKMEEAAHMASAAPKKKATRKKHKDKPKRPLSAYNIFFKDERANILAEIQAKQEEEKKAADAEEEKEGTDKKEDKGKGDDEGKAKKESEEEGDDDEEAKEQKKKRSVQGKVGFENLAKTIGQRWQALEAERLEKYKALAAEDMKRYKKAMEVFMAKLESEKNPKFGGVHHGGDVGEPAAKKLKTEEGASESS